MAAGRRTAGSASAAGGIGHAISRPVATFLTSSQTPPPPQCFIAANRPTHLLFEPYPLNQMSFRSTLTYLDISFLIGNSVEKIRSHCGVTANVYCHCHIARFRKWNNKYLRPIKTCIFNVNDNLTSSANNIT